jgi:hypothetical protein
MKERPILFNGEMVQAILDGRKIQTRRNVKVQPPTDRHQLLNIMDSTDRRQIGKSHWAVLNSEKTNVIESDKRYFSCPYGKLGDRLWVRETHAIVPRTAYSQSTGVQQVLRPDDNHDAAIYRQGWERSTGGIRWRPSIHMPRWASRITLEITNVRVERLHDITPDDAEAEGIVVAENTPQAVQQFSRLWRDINGGDSWASNPWVWVIEFKQVASGAAS